MIGSRLLEWALVGLVGGLLAYVMFPADPVVYPEVVVPARVILEREPDTIVSVLERIRYINVEPRQVATAPQGASSFVSSFCLPTVLEEVGDTTRPPPPPSILVRSIAHRPGWWWQKDELELFGVSSHGDLSSSSWAVRPGFTVAGGGSSLVVQYPRAGLARELLEFALPVLGGFALGRTF